MKKLVDIVVGGQYGDEGKGQICAWLAHHHLTEGHPYHFAVRVSGSNAEHRFTTPNNTQHTARVLPVAAWLDSQVQIVLGAGHTIKLDQFLSELKELTTMYGDQKWRVFIDPQAGVIEPQHTLAGKETAWRGSTHQGTGQAVAHKVLRDGQFKTAAHYPELQPYVWAGGVWSLMRLWLQQGLTGLIEGAQGALLSLNHGYYPYCTSKDVTPAALLAEAGIPTGAVREIYGVYRTVPMRVPGNSGPTGGAELAWSELEHFAKLSIPPSAKKQTDSGSIERIFLWSWEDFTKSVFLCGPTRMVLTFADWWPAGLMEEPDINQHIQMMEDNAGCPVVMVRYGPAWENYGTRGEGV